MKNAHEGGAEFIGQLMSRQETDFFSKKAQEKIAAESWHGRNAEVKARNFANCWLSEEAFKKILASKNKWFRHRGLYVGDAKGAVHDFIVKLNGNEVSIGLRSTSETLLKRYGAIAYPDDRLRLEQDKIADYIVCCSIDNCDVKFYGLIPKDEFLSKLDNAERLYSKNNQEYFRIVNLREFSYNGLVKFLDRLE